MPFTIPRGQLFSSLLIFDPPPQPQSSTLASDETVSYTHLILIGVLLGRFVCGFLCPFGWLQELLHKIPGKKLSTKKLKPLTYIKYAVLLFAVVLLPVLVVNDVGMGDPFFCKYICPQGVLEGAIPLSIMNVGIRSALGKLFTWKLAILIAVAVLSVLFYRPFCKWICPLGAFYALMNKVSLLGIQVDPVSYTHLDVYKRQLPLRAEER